MFNLFLILILDLGLETSDLDFGVDNSDCLQWHRRKHGMMILPLPVWQYSQSWWLTWEPEITSENIIVKLLILVVWYD